MSEDERLRSIILHRIDHDGMFVCPDIQRTAAQRYLERHPDEDTIVTQKAKRLVADTKGSYE